MSGEGYTVFGAGSVGTTLAALLGSAGVRVRIAGRAATGRLRLEGPAETVTCVAEVVTEPVGVILLCVHEPDVEGLCARWRGRPVVTFQNGVRSEERAARHGPVIGAVWRMTCTLLEPGVACCTGRGRVVVGRHPHGRDAGVEALAADLRRAGLDVAVSASIAADKWLKLLTNLASAPNALVRREDHGKEAFGALKADLVREAWDVLRRAGIEARSCDGRDPPPDEEIERQRATLLRPGPVRNTTWRRLARGLPPRERYHDTIVEVARSVGLEAPRNAGLLRLLETARAPECYALDEVLAALMDARR